MIKKISIMVFAIGILLVIVGVVKFKNNDNLEHNDNEDVSINLGEIFYDDFVKITTAGFEKKDNGYLLIYKIENNLENKIGVSIEKMSINEITTDILSNSVLVETGGSNVASIFISKDTLQMLQIKNILSLKLSFKIVVKVNDIDVIYSRKDSLIRTNKYGKYTQNYDYGEKIFEDNNMIVRYVKMIEDKENNKMKIRLLIQNKKSIALKIMLGNEWHFSFNNQNYFGDFNTLVDPLEYNVSDITFNYPDNINEQNEVLINFAYYKFNKLNKLSETDKINFIIYNNN